MKFRISAKAKTSVLEIFVESCIEDGLVGDYVVLLIKEQRYFETIKIVC